MPPFSSEMLAGYMGIFIFGYLMALVGIILPNLTDKLRLDRGQAGHFFLATYIGMALASVPAGLAMDRIGTKALVCLGLALVAMAMFALGRIGTASRLYPVALILGLGGSVIVSGENTMVSLANPQQREAAANMLNLFFGAGAFIAPLVVLPILRRRGFSFVLVASSLLPTLALAYHLAVPFPAPTQPLGFPLAQAGAVVLQPAILLLGLLIFLYVGTEFSVWSWTVTFFTSERSWSQEAAARLISAFAITIIIGRLLAQWLLRLVGAEVILLLSAVGAAVFLSVLFLLEARRFALPAALLSGLFMASIFPTDLGLTGRHAPQLVGTAIGLVVTCGWLGAMVIPPTVGYISKRSGIARGILVTITAAFLMIVVTGSLWLYTR